MPKCILNISRILMHFGEDAKLVFQDPELETYADLWGFSIELNVMIFNTNYHLELYDINYTEKYD